MKDDDMNQNGASRIITQTRTAFIIAGSIENTIDGFSPKACLKALIASFSATLGLGKRSFSITKLWKWVVANEMIVA